MRAVAYRRLDLPATAYLLRLAGALALLGIGLACAWCLEHQGHWVSGMDTQMRSTMSSRTGTLYV